MIALDLEMVLVVAGGLVLLASWLAAYRPDARAVGLAVGWLVFAVGIAVSALESHPTGLLLDAVSAPRIPVVGLGLVAVFAVLPRRHADPVATLAVLAHAVAHLALTLAPTGPVSGGLWVLCSALTWAALGDPTARRLAMPYLALSAGAGLVGSIFGGDAGTWLLLLAVAIRLGVFPFHSWAVASYQLAPTTWAAAAVAPMSAIALVARAPLGFEGSVPTVLMTGLAVAALLTAGLAIVQQELSRSVGFLTASVGTIVLLGVMDADHIGHLGGLLMWNVTGLALLGLGLVAAALRSRNGCVRVDRYNGLSKQAPLFATVFLLFGLTAVGAPGTADFASEDLVLHGAMAHHSGLLLLFVSTVSAQGYAVLHLFFRVFFGPPADLHVPEALPRERIALVALGALLVTSGLAPQLLVNRWLAGEAPSEVASIAGEAP
ncbi:MAG: hypothetical protein H6737_04635 [Alphaproteobacteria bacterium]|nr:hypothetical protein [Alphaproteobacteria bacterium]